MRNLPHPPPHPRPRIECSLVDLSYKPAREKAKYFGARADAERAGELRCIDENYGNDHYNIFATELASAAIDFN